MSDTRPRHLQPRCLPNSLLKELGIVCPPSIESSELQFTGVTLDSRDVRPGDLYAALPGERTHGAVFAQQAAIAGAHAILTDQAGAELILGSELPLLIHASPREVLGEISAELYGRPSERLRLIGITGTNGKTTTASLIESVLAGDGRCTGLIGTVGTRIHGEPLATERTTPEAPALQALLALMVERGVTDVVMEVSSHALSLHRVDGLEYDVSVFTNLSQDHLDFHGSMEEYFSAKASLFEARRTHSAVICVDDAWGRQLVELVGGSIPLARYSLDGHDAEWSVSEVRAEHDGSHFVLATSGVVREVLVPMPGRFNVANAVAALAACAGVGVPLDEALDTIAGASGVSGRMQPFDSSDGIRAYVDYAHTPDAVERAIEAVRSGHLAEGASLITVIGCGGDRDAGKRPLMGRIAAMGSSLVVVTDDNPRSEAPEAIRAQVVEGVTSVPGAKFVDIGDRREAITWAVACAQPGDVVLVLGKGHEKGQEVAGQVLPFDDADEVARAMSDRDKSDRQENAEEVR